MRAFDELQRRFAEAWDAHELDSHTEHVLVIMPSFSVTGQLLEHYRARFAAMEHRFLLIALAAARRPACEVVYVTSLDPGEAVLDYYASLVPEPVRESFRTRLHVVTVADRSWRPLADKLLDNTDAVARVRSLVAGRPAMLEVWHVTEVEQRAALALGVPIDGTDPALRPVAFKSAGRHLFHSAGIATPAGREDVHDIEEVAEAVRVVRASRPGTGSIVVKLDDSGAGDGNVVIDIRTPDGTDLSGSRLLRRLTASLSDAYVGELGAGGVVEELIVGEELRSPSAQIDIDPRGAVIVVSTHEQVLGGPHGQVYSGCTFPAHRPYAAELARCASVVGERLGALGARGRVGVDFLAVRQGEDWLVEAIEINLRKGGTTHPFAALAALVPGRYDAAEGAWITPDGQHRCYAATDNLVDAAWVGLEPASVIEAVHSAGIQFDPTRTVGVVLHMLSGLGVDGRIGFVAIARDPVDAQLLVDETRRAVDRCAGRSDAGAPVPGVAAG